MMTEQPYALTLTGANSDIFNLADALGFEAPIQALSVSMFEVDDTSSYVQALFESKGEAEASLNNLTLNDRISVSLVQLGDEDWVSKSQAGLAPIEAGRFLIYGEHDANHVDLTHHIGLQINAGLAFGTGHHGTTAGCLVLFDRLLQQNILSTHCLDLGCGAGILSIAAAKILQRSVLATDIDQDAVDVTLENAVINKVSPLIDAQRSDGFNNSLFKGRKFDLIFANILAGPLMDLAPEISDHMSDNGYVILSGILKEQKNTVATHFNGHGLDIIDDVPLAEWVSLLGRKSHA
ncbi:MAG: 50S ribosomal protein L11 methyltransferase [Maricaulaceae bacterium]